MTRTVAAIGVVAAVVVGVASRLLQVGVPAWDKSVGDVCYAVMVGFMVAFVRPATRARGIGMVTIAICFAVEVFQLTGLPRRAPWLIRRALGDTFAWHDLACYVVGAAVVAAVASRARRSAPREEGAGASPRRRS